MGFKFGARGERRDRALGGPAPGSRGAAARQGRLITGLPPHLEEDVRLVGALAELFATIAAERLMNDDPSGNASRPTLPVIALAVGAALCAPLLERQATRHPGRRNQGQRDLVTGGARRSWRSSPSPMGRSGVPGAAETAANDRASGALSIVPPSTKGEGHAYA
jgi:hypothetical protein